MVQRETITFSYQFELNLEIDFSTAVDEFDNLNFRTPQYKFIRIDFQIGDAGVKALTQCKKLSLLSLMNCEVG